MSKVFVFEGKRLIPLFILLMLLITVSVYDVFFNTSEPIAVTGDIVHFVSIEQGKLFPLKQLLIFDNQESFVSFLQLNNISHPQESFDPNNQVAVISMNFTIQNLVTSTDDLGRQVLNVAFTQRNSHYKIYIVPRDLQVERQDVVWNFFDERGRKTEEIRTRVNP